MAISVPIALARAQRLARQSAQALHSEKLPGLCVRRKTSRLDAQLHPRRSPPLPLHTLEIGAGNPGRPQKWAQTAAVALSRGTGAPEGISSQTPVIVRFYRQKLVALGRRPALRKQIRRLPRAVRSAIPP